MLEKEALIVLENLSRIMAAKMEEPIFHVRGSIKGWIVIVVMISYSRIICGARLPSPLQDSDPDWGLSLSLSMAQ